MAAIVQQIRARRPAAAARCIHTTHEEVQRRLDEQLLMADIARAAAAARADQAEDTTSAA